MHRRIEDISATEPNLRYVRSYAYLQPFISNAICREFQDIVDPESKQQPEYFVPYSLITSVLLPG